MGEQCDPRYAILRGDQILAVDDAAYSAWYWSTFEYDPQGLCYGIGDRQVAKCTDPYVSTAFLGTAFGCLPDGRALWFETLYYGHAGTPHDMAHTRYRLYRNYAEAVAGHDQILAALRDGQDPASLVLPGTSERWG